MFLCNHIYFEQKTPKKLIFVQKCYVLLENNVKFAVLFCQKDENKININFESFKDNYFKAFSKRLIIVSQNVKFEPNMGLTYLLLSM